MQPATAPATTTASLGPGTIATAGTPGGPAFTLSAPEWLAIQTYVMEALVLPTTTTALKTALGSGAPSDMTEFQPLVACYAAINAHCANWQTTVFPASVKLANDVTYYGNQLAPTYYAAIQDKANILISTPDDQQAKDDLTTMLTKLSGVAQGYADNANAVATQIQTFADQTTADKATLVGPNGDAGLLKTYTDEYGANGTMVQQLTTELANQVAILKEATDEYNHDVIVAATTPTYAWWFPLGTIPAAIVAGIYGKRATDALNHVNSARDTIATLQGEIQADTNLMIALNNAERGITNIEVALASALPVIQKIAGTWSTIQADLQNIVQLISTDISQALPVIMNLGIAEAITAWSAVAALADAYQLNAYVVVSNDTPAPATVQ